MAAKELLAQLHEVAANPRKKKTVEIPAMNINVRIIGFQ